MVIFIFRIFIYYGIKLFMVNFFIIIYIYMHACLILFLNVLVFLIHRYWLIWSLRDYMKNTTKFFLKTAFNFSCASVLRFLKKEIKSKGWILAVRCTVLEIGEMLRNPFPSIWGNWEKHIYLFWIGNICIWQISKEKKNTLKHIIHSYNQQIIEFFPFSETTTATRFLYLPLLRGHLGIDKHIFV